MNSTLNNIMMKKKISGLENYKNNNTNTNYINNNNMNKANNNNNDK